MSQIFYKFKSAKDYDCFKFEGSGVPVWELKKEIIAAKRLGKSTDFDLVLTNAQSNQDYGEETIVIPKNSQIIVKRVPASAGGRRQHHGQQPQQSHQSQYQQQHHYQRSFNTGMPTSVKPISTGTSGAKLGAGGNDEDKLIQSMMQANTHHWQQNQEQMPMQQNVSVRKMFKGNATGAGASRPFGMTPPDTYVCFRCGQKGHFIQHCPTNSDPNYDRAKIRKTTGIPRSFLKPVSAIPPASATDSTSPDGASNTALQIPGYLVTPDGSLVVATPNEQEWDRLATIKSLTTADDDLLMNIAPESIPNTLKCSICNKIMRHAVRTACCQANYCDECVRRPVEEALLGGVEASFEENNNNSSSSSSRTGNNGTTTITASSKDGSFYCPSCKKGPLTLQMIEPDYEKRDKVDEFVRKNSKFFLEEEEEDVGKDKDGRNSTNSNGNNQQKIPLPPHPMMMMPLPFPPPPFFFPPPPSHGAPHPFMMMPPPMGMGPSKTHPSATTSVGPVAAGAITATATATAATTTTEACRKRAAISE